MNQIKRIDNFSQDGDKILELQKKLEFTNGATITKQESSPIGKTIVPQNNTDNIYTSNIFAVLGLRSLFFLLRGAVNKFAYLQQGIAIVLIFIGLKMLAGIVGVKIETYISLMVIVICLAGSIMYSVQIANKRKKNE